MAIGETEKKKSVNSRRFRGIAVSAGAAALCAVLLLSGCGNSSSAFGGNAKIFTVEDEDCTDQEVKVILLQFQKEYSSVYGVNLWTSDQVDQDELIRYILESAVSQLADVYTLDAVADSLGISLGESEREQAQNAATYYVSSMGEEELDFVDIGESEAESLFERYLLAQKTYERIIGDVSTEVSDDEALVMDMQKIRVTDEELAYDILSRVRGGEDFTALAQMYSEDEDIETAVSRLTYDEAVTDLLFSLETGDYSGVIEMDGSYYIFYCENYYDETLTRQNKGVVLRRRREDAVREMCEMYTDASDSVLFNNALSKIEVDPSLELSGPSFKEVYQSFMEQE